MSLATQLVNGRTLLHVAVMHGDTNYMNELLVKDPSLLNTRDYNGETPLYSATIYQNIDCVRILLEHDCDTLVKDMNGETVLHAATTTGNIEILRLIINSKNIDLNVKDKNGCTALHLAAMLGNKVVVETLLDAGVDKTVKDIDGDLASSYTVDQTIRYFIENYQELPITKGVLL